MKRARLRAWVLALEEAGAPSTAGFKFDLVSAAAQVEVEPGWISEGLLRYEMELDRMLRDLESAISARLTKSGDVAREMLAAAKQGDEEKLREKTEGYVQVMARPQIIRSAIRSLHIRSVEEITVLIDQSTAEQLRTIAYAQLYPFVDQEDEPLKLQQKCEKLPNLTDEQRSAMNVLADEFRQQREATRRNIGQLYARVISAQSYLGLYHAQCLAALENDSTIQPSLLGIDDFEQAVAHWKQEVRKLENQMLDLLTIDQRVEVGRDSER
jgi:hypothetical protein